MPFVDVGQVEAGEEDPLSKWRDPLASRAGRVDPSQASLRAAGQDPSPSDPVYLRWDVESRAGPRPKQGPGGLVTMSSEHFRRPPTGVRPRSPVVPPSPAYQRRSGTSTGEGLPPGTASGEERVMERRRYGSNDDFATVRGLVNSLAQRQVEEYQRLQEFVKDERAKGASHADKITAWQSGRGGGG